MSETTPPCTTPVPVRPGSPSLMDQFQLDDDSFDLVTSPGSKRCPTLKDYAEKIKQLKNENFQLRVRIYLSEQKTGVKTSSSDLAVLYSHFSHFQNPTSVGNGPLFPSHSTAQSSVSTTSGCVQESLNNALEKLKAERMELDDKLRTYEGDLMTKQQQIAELSAKNERLLMKQQEMEHELAAANSTIQRLTEEHGSSSRNNDQADKLACFAFDQTDDLDLINAEFEAKLADKDNEIRDLEADLANAQRKLDSAERKISALKSDLRKHESEKSLQDNKIMELSASLKEFGLKYVKLQHEKERLERKYSELVKLSDRHGRTDFKPDSEKWSAIQRLVEHLQSRMKELTDFVETLLQLESQKVVSLTGLTDENRENLVKAIEQSRLFSENIDKLFEKDSARQYKSISNYFGSFHKAPLHYSGAKSSAFSSFERVRQKSGAVQCELLNPDLLNSLESANTYINKLKNDIRILERINGQLVQEKEELVSQVKTLESNMNVLKMTNHVDRLGTSVSANTKLKEENRKLLKRLTVTEDALRNLHAEHAKLVGELRTLRSTYQKSSKASVGGMIVDSTRPSDSTSPDLGIDSGHDGAANSDDSNANNYKEENRVLRTTNRELAIKLKQTRQALDMTLEKLNSTTKEKEQVEKAICRQLHKTHTILRQAKRSVEKFTNSQCQENIMPTS